MSDFIPIGIDIGSIHARVAIGNLTLQNNSLDGIVDTQPLPDIISNAQGSRYTLALVGTDNAEADGKPEETRHLFGEAARRALAREKKATISKDPSSMVRELIRAEGDDAADKVSKAAAFLAHMTELACDATSANAANLRTVVSVPLNSTPEEQTKIVETVERGIQEALAARFTGKEVKAMKKKEGGDDPSVMAVISDPAAVCIAHGLTENEHPGVIDLAAPKAQTSSTWKHALVIGWGASGLTATHICRKSASSSLLTIVKQVSDATCSGTDIIAALGKHCASMFERKNKVSGLLDSKKACHKLEIACESAVRTLSRAPTVAVAVDGLFEGIDMNVLISRPRFDMLMSGILRKAETLLQTFTGDEGVDFDVVLMSGNVCDMPSATTLIRTKLFPNVSAGRSDVPPDEAVAMGCARHAASILSCDTHSKMGAKRTDNNSLGPATRKVKACPIAIGICRVENIKENGQVEEVISNSAVPLVEVGEPLPVNVTRKVTCDDMEDSYIAIVQMGGAAGKSKVIGKIEKIEDKSFEITMGLSTAGEMTLAVNGGPTTSL